MMHCNGVRLTDMYRGVYSVREISVYVKYLPRGCPLWEAIGGRNAITAEQEEAWIIQHLLAQLGHQAGGGHGPPPKGREYPKGWKEHEAERRRTLTNAQAFRQKRLQGKKQD